MALAQFLATLLRILSTEPILLNQRLDPQLKTRAPLFVTAHPLTKLITFSKTEPGRRTLGYYLLFICLGLSTAVIGPTLPTLAEQTHTPLGNMGWLFLAGAIGYFAGTLLGGRVFDRMRGHPLLGIAQCASALMFALIPFMPSLGGLLIVFVLKGTADGLMNTGANTLLVWTHRDKVGPYMNGLHFFFGLGAFLAPLLVAQVAEVAGGYRWVYWGLAVLAALVGLNALTLPGQPRPVPPMPAELGRPTVTRQDYTIAFMAALFLFFYVGAELAFGGWIYTYATTLKLMSVTEGAYLNSAFWLAFTLGRLMSIPMATRLPPQSILWIALLSCLVIMTGLILKPDTRWILWAVTIGLGFCLAPIWPTGFTLAGQSLRLTARLSGLILLGDSLGAMVLPWLVGQVIAQTGPHALTQLVLGSLLGNVIAFVGLSRLRPPVPKPSATVLSES